MNESGYKVDQIVYLRQDVTYTRSDELRRFKVVRPDKGWSIDEEGTPYVDRRQPTILVKRVQGASRFFDESSIKCEVALVEDVCDEYTFEKLRNESRGGTRRLEELVVKLEAEARVAEDKIRSQEEELHKLRALESVVKNRQPNIYALYKSGRHPMSVDDKGTRDAVRREVFED